MLSRSRWQSWIAALTAACFYTYVSSVVAERSTYTPIKIKSIKPLGPQLSPGVTNVSRDGGYSSLINGRIVWIYDDTECFDKNGQQLSFISNTASYSDQPDKNISTVADFGVIEVGKDENGKPKKAILADDTVGTGGWIPFQADELDFNNRNKGNERVAIWPGTSPTPFSTTQALLFAPLVYVDNKPKDPSKEYLPRGMTLITITATESGPVATRQGDLIIPGDQVQYGGFATLIGFTDKGPDSEDRDVYMVGIADNGLQVARVGINDIRDWSKYKFYDRNPENMTFTDIPAKRNETSMYKIYFPGEWTGFTSGNIFYSPYFKTFVMIYFNKQADSTFYMRYLLAKPNGPEDVAVLTSWESQWSPEQKIYMSPTKQGGYNYAGTAHPEFFNRQYFAPTLYPVSTSKAKRVNKWYGSSLLAEDSPRIDGKYLLLSWTAQLGSGLYQVQLALLEFDDIPPFPTTSNPPDIAFPSATATGSASSSYHKQTWEQLGVLGLAVLLVPIGVGVMPLWV